MPSWPPSSTSPWHPHENVEIVEVRGRGHRNRPTVTVGFMDLTEPSTSSPLTGTRGWWSPSGPTGGPSSPISSTAARRRFAADLVTDTRAKTANLRRDPGSRSTCWATTSCSTRLEGASTSHPWPPTPTTTRSSNWWPLPGRPGKHPDWDEYRAAIVTDQRLILATAAEHAYGIRAAS